MTREEAINLILSVLGKAEKKHPGWPDDKIHAAAILAEKAGELIQAANDYEYKLKNDELKFDDESESIRSMKIEAAQCGAITIRFLMNL